MADYYTEFSFAVQDLTPEEADWLKEVTIVGEEVTDHYNDEVTRFFNFEEEYDQVTWEMQDNDTLLWIHSDESGNLEAAANFVQVFLRQFRPGDYETFEWAGTASRPIIDSNCGGAVFITANEVKYHSTHEWLSEQIDAWKKDVYPRREERFVETLKTVDEVVR